MSEVEHRRSPGVAFAGFAVAGVLLVAVLLAFQLRVFARFGWAGSEYAYLFLGIAVGAAVIGAVLRAAGHSSPWRPLGLGLLLGGAAGVLFTISMMVFWYAFSNFTF
jgi:hypothetical protein